MNHAELIASNFNNLSKLLNGFSEVDCQIIAREARNIAGVLQNAGTVFWCGNGGSAADAQHFSAELTGRFVSNRRSLASISLSSDTSALTCIANDFGYEFVFERQLEGLAKKDDFLVALSTSGESPNILRVLNTAKRLGVRTFALLGKNGGSAINISDSSIIISSDETARIQEMHKIIGHSICQVVERELGFKN